MPKKSVEDILVKTVEERHEVKEVSFNANVPDNLEILDQQSN